MTPVQNYLAGRATEILSKNLKTKVTVAHVRIDFLNHFLLQGVYIEDQSHDTLLYAGEVQVRITDWFIFKDKPVLHYLALNNALVHMYRTPVSNSWNYDFIADAFSTGKKPGGKNKPFEFDFKKVELGNVRFHMDDKWIGQDLDFDVGSFTLNAKDLDFNKKLLDVNDINIKKADVYVNIYKGGKPPRQKHSPIDTFDTTPFNPEKWAVKAGNISLDGCTFHLTMDNRIPVPDQFDENHLIINNIQVAISKASITGDTIHGNINHLSAQDRCGLAIKNMRSKVTVSPIASICDNLYLETNNSKIQHYYAMHYKHFPNFNSYIDSVIMVAHLKDAVIDARDIAYFAPQLKRLPNIIVHASGDGRGTVANLGAQHLEVTDGNTVLKGSITMKGLPDIYKTYITYSDGELFTTGEGVLHYVPGLKNSPNISLESITYAYFKGKYEGYIENFFIDGTLKTNLGSITSNIKMNVPGFSSNAAVYSGMVTTDNLQLGILFKQPIFGAITLKENISGSSFNPDIVQLNMNGTIEQFTIRGYAYHNISTNGTIAKKQFTGKLMVDDPNLALEFDGGIDYAQANVNINARAHLLGSNFKNLKFTADTITASADFDLNCTGSNIDNFSGYAKLFNIDMKRNMHKLALDSIYVHSTGDSTHRKLTIQSNDIVAQIKGNYQLSKLPASVQYYLSKYLPNYISAPAKYAPDQNLEFTITTANIDSILAVAVPLVRGFDSSTISGSLNTFAQKLTLNASIPYGSIGNFHMSDIVITGQGNLDLIALNTNIDNVAVGDSFLNGSLSVTTTIGNDSVAFNIATTTPDTSSSITLNGQILARKDSLFFTILPSQFYLSQAKWDIAGGSKIVYASKYLLVQGVTLSSGLQRITAATQLQNNDKSIIINTENLDLGQLGSWAGLAAYQPDGRVNGTININKIFENLYITANIKATDVKLGTDTVGTINLIGYYDGSKKVISLDPQTGIFRNDASVTARGDISFDSTTHQQLNGTIKFYNAPVVWASPFLAGIMSRLSGTLNGEIAFSGSAYDPDMNGAVTLLNAGVRLDYMGCNYTIPAANVTITKKRIEFGKVQLYDSYKNVATLTGHFSHNLFKNMHMHLSIKSDKFEVMNLSQNDNNIFYGNLIASMDSFTIKGPFNDIRFNIYNAAAAEKSKLFIPLASGSDVGTYTYVSFKTYGKSQDKLIKKNRNKISVYIDASLNTLAEMHIVIDPTTGDEIKAKGWGRVELTIPPNNDIRINGLYTIDEGLYTYTYKKLFITRNFKLQPNSTIGFNGPFAQTTVDVDAIYAVKARLIDMLPDQNIVIGSEKTDAQTPQMVDVLLHMRGYLNKPTLTFDLDLEDNHSQGTLAYRQLMLINNDPQQQFTQATSLILFGQFITPEGIGTSTLQTGAINSLSQAISSSASTGLTNLINKITGDKQLSLAVKYTNYNYSDPSTFGTNNRYTASIIASQNFFKNRLTVELGSTSDWGHATSSSNTSNFNITGDFRIQYQVKENSNVRLNAFRTSDYDVTLDRDIQRTGIGVSWRKSFDNIGEFFHGNKYDQKQKENALKAIQNTPIDTSGKKPGGTD